MDRAAASPRDGWPLPAAYESLDALAHDLGRATASEGLDLDHAIERLRLVERMAPRRERRRFDLATLAVALTNGWVEGVLQREVDVSLEVLRVDAHEQYRRCEQLGLDAAEAIALVVFRTKVEVRSDAVPAAIAVLRALARQEFAGGESVAVAHDKVLVLAQRTPDLVQRVRLLATRMNDAVAHVGMSASYWIEPLSSDATWLDDHLDALVA
jgi:hypothetical protein